MEMTYVSLKEFVASEGITNISPVRENKNGYPFLTVLRGSGEDSAENIYFTIKAAETVTAGTPITSIAKDLFVCKPLNAAGEERTKLSFKGSSEYTPVENLFA